MTFFRALYFLSDFLFVDPCTDNSCAILQSLITLRNNLIKDDAPRLCLWKVRREIFYQRLPFEAEVPARTSRKISTGNQLVCSFFSLAFIFLSALFAIPGKRHRAYITADRNMPNTLLSLHNIYIQRGVNRCIIHGMYIHNIIFTQTTSAERTREGRAKKLRLISSSLFRRRRGTSDSGL